MNADAVERSDRHDARDGAADPTAGARTQGWCIRQNWCEKHIAIKQQAIGSAGEANGEPGAGGKPDQRTGLAAFRRSKLGAKVREVIIDLPDVIDIAAPA